MVKCLRRLGAAVSVILGLATPLAMQAQAQEISLPILVPITGFLSLEGTSQRNGALLALKQAPAGLPVRGEISDTGVAPETAVNALERAIDRGNVAAVAASMLGTQMLAMLPVALDHKVPLVTVSGTARITELNNPYVFRFFPGDNVTKVAHVRYAVEELGRKRVALIYQMNAYGQSGRLHILANLKKLGLEPVFEEGLDPNVRDMSSALGKARAADPDVLFLHLHSGPTALTIRQARTMKLTMPIVAGSAIHQPPTVALLEPSELAGVCGETNASPISGGGRDMEAFLAAYHREFNAEPDGFALGQYDGMRMVLAALAQGARTPESVTNYLATTTYRGLAMTYRSDGAGNMAHSAVIVCYDGKSRVPKIVKRYDNITGALTN